MSLAAEAFTTMRRSFITDEAKWNYARDARNKGHTLLTDLGAMVFNERSVEGWQRVTADPDQPDGVDGPWRYASMIDGAFEAGVWEAPIESWREDGYPVDEFVMIISGHLRLTADDGTVLELRSGDLGYIPRGWAGVWEVVEPVRKAYVIKP